MKKLSLTLTLLTLLLLIQGYGYALWGIGDRQITSLSEFVPANSIDSSSVMLAQSAMSMLGQTVVIDDNASQGQSTIPVYTLDQAQALLSYDIVSAIQSSTNKPQTFAAHTQQLNQAISQYNQSLTTYETKVTQAQTTLIECINSKKVADAAVVEAINNNRLSTIASLVQASVTAGQCETQARITNNAYTLVVTKYNHVISLLTQKLGLLQNHQTTMIKYPEVIADPAIIDELYQIASQF